MYTDITGIILSGGKSKRMGTNKSFLKIDGKTVIERTVDLMKGLFDRVLLITNEPEQYEFLNLEIYQDIYKNVGPIAGIHSGLIHSGTDKNFIISCDMPLITKNVIEFIIKKQTGKSITITKADGFIQQLCGVYSKEVIPEIENLIENKTSDVQVGNHKCSCKVLQLVQNIDSDIINIETEYEDYEKGMFLNMNRPEDYENLKSRDHKR